MTSVSYRVEFNPNARKPYLHAAEAMEYTRRKPSPSLPSVPAGIRPSVSGARTSVSINKTRSRASLDPLVTQSRKLLCSWQEGIGVRFGQS